MLLVMVRDMQLLDMCLNKYTGAQDLYVLFTISVECNIVYSIVFCTSTCRQIRICRSLPSHFGRGIIIIITIRYF